MNIDNKDNLGVELQFTSKDKDERYKVIHAQSNFLIGAGAGSGKTSLIVDKIISLIASGNLNVRNLVAITYTVAAADELKLRIQNKILLYKDDNTLSKEIQGKFHLALHELQFSLIGTIHSFCLHWIRYFSLLPQNINTIDSKVKVLRSSQSKEIYCSFFWRYIQSIEHKKLSNKSTPEENIFFENIKNILFLSDLKKNSGYTKEDFDQDFYNCYQNLFVIENISINTFSIKSLDEFKKIEYQIITEYISVFNKLANCYTGSKEKVLQPIESLKSIFNTITDDIIETEISVWDYIVTLATASSTSSIGNSGSASEIKKDSYFENIEEKEILSLLKFYVKIFLNKIDIDDIYKLSENQKKYILNSIYPGVFIIHKDTLMNEYIRYLWYSVSLDFSIIYRNYKSSIKVLDYQDQLFFAKNFILSPDNKEVLLNKIKYIFIDEYQDTDPLQFEIFNYLKNLGIPTIKVGDQNQAIYSFRGGTPHIIISEEKSLPKNDKSFLFVNFRSHTTILNFSNLLFNKEHTDDSPCFIPNYLEQYQDLISEAKNLDNLLTPMISILRFFNEDQNQENKSINADDNQATTTIEGTESNVVVDEKKNQENKSINSEDNQAADEEEDDDDDDENNNFLKNIKNRRELEANFFAQKIVDILQEAKTNNLPKPKIAILFGTFTALNVYDRYLKKYNLTFYAQGREILENSYILNPLLLICKFLYRADDTISLIGLLRSHLVALSDIEINTLFSNTVENEAVLLFLQSPNLNVTDEILEMKFQSIDVSIRDKLLHFFKKIRYFYQKLYSISLSNLIEIIINSFPWYEIFNLMGDSPQRSMNKINGFITLAQDIEDSSINRDKYIILWEYTNYLNALFNNTQDGQEDRLFKIEQETIDSYDVCLTTIHSSKGLEYDVVFLGDITYELLSNVNKTNLFFTQFFSTTGCNLFLKNDMYYSQGQLKEATLNETKQEKIRLLYVALTRAKVRIYLSLFDLSKTDKDTYHDYILSTLNIKLNTNIMLLPDGLDIESNIYFSTIYTTNNINKTSTFYNQNFNPLDINLSQKLNYSSVSFVSGTSLMKEMKQIKENEFIIDDEDIINNEKMTKIMSNETIIAKNKAIENWESKLFLNQEYIKDIKDFPHMDRGVLVHYVFEIIDLKNPIWTKESVLYLANAFQIDNTLNNILYEMTNTAVEFYKNSDLFNLLKVAKIVGKELPFSSSYKVENNLKIAVGYIDLVIELENDYKDFEKGIYIIDYKTNKHSEHISWEMFSMNLLNLYEEPMELYKKTVSTFFGESKKYFNLLYHVPSGKLISYL